MSQLAVTHDAYKNKKSVTDAALSLTVRMAGVNSEKPHSGNKNERTEL
jgi:hypothetical protein